MPHFSRVLCARSGDFRRPLTHRPPLIQLLYPIKLRPRDDDREQTIRHRLDVYAEQTRPLIAFYADDGILLGIDATGPVEEITARAMTALRRFMT